MQILPVWGYVAIAIVMVLVSAGITHLFARGRVMALPNARTAHDTPTPTAGGIGPATSLMLGMTILAWTAGVSPALLNLTGLGAIMALVGYLDDRHEFRTGWKFLVIAIVSVAMALALGPVHRIPFDNWFIDLPWIVAVLGTALWAFVVINGVNFMDGADGVVPLSAFTGAFGLFVLSFVYHVPNAAVSAGLLMAALLGFLPFNVPKARIFLGDTGSLLIGSWLAGTGLLLIARGPEPALWIMPLLFMPWLSDILLTMAYRLAKGENMLDAHNAHLYQLAVRKRPSHFQVALGLSLQMLVCFGVALLFRGSATSAFFGFAAAASFALVVHLMARAKPE